MKRLAQVTRGIDMSAYQYPWGLSIYSSRQLAAKASPFKAYSHGKILTRYDNWLSIGIYRGNEIKPFIIVVPLQEIPTPSNNWVSI